MSNSNFSTSARSPISLSKLCLVLERRYGLSRHHNLRDAFWELIFIIVSLRTAESVYRRVFRSLRDRFGTIEALAAARLTALEKILQPAGLSRLKGRQIRDAARAVHRDFGVRGLTAWGRAFPDELEDYLCTLAGVARKVAKCVSMYACDAQSLPVDAHVWRVLSRLGHAPGGRLTEHRALQLEARVPRKLRYAVHVLCVSHGREICRRRPLCSVCPLKSECPSAVGRQLRSGARPKPRQVAGARSFRSAGRPTFLSS